MLLHFSESKIHFVKNGEQLHVLQMFSHNHRNHGGVNCRQHWVHPYLIACCWLFVASFCLSPECIPAFTVHSVMLCINYLALAVSKARSHSQQWQSTKFISLYNQDYVQKALFVENNMRAGSDMRYVHGQLRTTQG